MQRENEASYLKQIHIFNSLSEDEISTLAALTRKRPFRQGEVIFHRDDPGQVLYVIKEGKVKICLTSPDGQEIALAVLGQGECFGELALLDGRLRSTDAIALEKVECLTLQRGGFQDAIMKHPKIAIQVIEVLCERLRRTNQQVEDLTFLDVDGRVAKKLLELAHDYGVKVADGTQINMRLTQQELAFMVGASRESINKVLGYFTEKGYINVDRQKYTIYSIEDLQRRIY